jgi:ribosome maturation factor RimP
MDLSKYKKGSKVKIDLNNSNYYYEGMVIEVDNNSICIQDKKNKIVTIKEDSISFIREIE